MLALDAKIFDIDDETMIVKSKAEDKENGILFGLSPRPSRQWLHDRWRPKLDSDRASLALLVVDMGEYTGLRLGVEALFKLPASRSYLLRSLRSVKAGLLAPDDLILSPHKKAIVHL